MVCTHSVKIYFVSAMPAPCSKHKNPTPPPSTESSASESFCETEHKEDYSGAQGSEDRTGLEKGLLSEFCRLPNTSLALPGSWKGCQAGSRARHGEEGPSTEQG